MKRTLHTILLLLVAGITFAQTYPRKCTEEDIPSSERKRYYDEAKKHVTYYYLQIPAAIGDLDNREVLIDAIMAAGQTSLKPEFLLDGISGLTPVSPDQYFSKLDTQYKDMVDEMEFQINNIKQGEIMMKTGVSCYIPVEYDLALQVEGKLLFKRRCRMYCLFPRLAASKLIKTMQVEPVREIIAYKPLGKGVVKGEEKTKSSSFISNFQNKHYTNQIFQKAENGDAHAQYELGCWYYYGTNVEKSLINAFKWYSKAAEQEHIEAKIAVAKCYYYGKGVNKSYKKAYEYFESATRTENQLAVNKEAVYFLAFMQEHGQGCERQLVKAVENYQKCGIYKDAPDRILQILDKNDFVKYVTTNKHKKGYQSCNGTIYATEKNGKTNLLIGAVVLVVGSDIGIVTDLDGNFNLTGIKPGDVICSSFVGYENFYYEWKEGDEKKHHKFILKAK